jgi:hypothetical protein
MAIGKSLAKMNQGTINALIAFLVRIVFFLSSSCNAFVLGVQVFAAQRHQARLTMPYPLAANQTNPLTMRLFLHSSWLLHPSQPNF